MWTIAINRRWGPLAARSPRHGAAGANRLGGTSRLRPRVGVRGDDSRVSEHATTVWQASWLLRSLNIYRLTMPQRTSKLRTFIGRSLSFTKIR